MRYVLAAIKGRYILNRGRHGHLWICVACGKQLAGPKLPPDEIEALAVFAVLVSEKHEKKKASQAITAPNGAEECKMNSTQITLTFEGTPSPKDIAARLRFQAGLLEGMSGKDAASKKNTDAPTETEEVETAPADDADDDFAETPKKRGRKASQADFEEETETEAADDDADFTTDEEPEEAPAPKKAKAPKGPTLDDVNAACKAHAKKHGIDKTKAILQKKFGTQSVLKLKPEQYAGVIAAVKV